MIQIRDLVVEFDSFRVLDGVSLDIASGSTQILLGSSGSGKSTLIRALVGLVDITSGELSPSPTAIVEESGYVIQEGGLFPHMTIRENLIVRARHRGWRLEKIKNRLKELLDMVSLGTEVLDRYPHEVSGGQRQRLSLVRALFCDPKLLLMDEPLGALDPITRFELQKDLRQLFNRLKKTVLLVTHDINEAFYLGDRVTLLNNGKIEQEGQPQDFLSKPKSAYVEKFVNSQRSFIK